MYLCHNNRVQVSIRILSFPKKTLLQKIHTGKVTASITAIGNECSCQEFIHFPKINEEPQNSRGPEGIMEQVQYQRPTNVRCHHSKFSCLADLALRMCDFLVYVYVLPPNWHCS